MIQEEVWIRKSCVAALLRLASLGLSIIEYDNFIDTVDSTCASDLTSETCLLVMSYSAKAISLLNVQSNLSRYAWKKGSQGRLRNGIEAYFAMILPGSATLNV